MSALDRLLAADAVNRLWAKDGSLFSADERVAADAGSMLGWVGLAAAAADSASSLAEAARAAVASGITDVVLLGMGGSSLAPFVLGEVLAPETGPRLHVLDTTSPYAVLRTVVKLWPASTLVVVSSKSGGVPAFPCASAVRAARPPP